MWMRQVFVACLCVLLASLQINAVVNSSPNSKTPVESASATSDNDENADSESASPADSTSASSEKEVNRREAPLGLSDVFGSPIPLDGIYGPPIDSYLPETSSNLGLPLPVYGVPTVGNNFIYPAPPPDIPPPLPTLSLSYGVPSAPLKTNFGPPKITYGPAKIYGPPKHTLKYGPPFLQRPPKPFNPPIFNKGPKTFYGPPRFQTNLRPGKEQYGILKAPKPYHGPPKSTYGPSKLVYGPPKQIRIPQKQIYRPLTDGLLNPPPLLDNYGPPTINIDIISDVGKQQVPVNYGPPEPVPHGPPHPGAPAPPTPPDIKYDGWQPIPGLISRPPSDLYGVPQQQNHGSVDVQFTGDFIPPPIGGNGVQTLGLQESYRTTAEVSDSYGAPLNTVTGSGGIISTSVEAQGHIKQQNQHHGDINIGLSAIGLGDHDNSVSVVKSVGYELFNNNAGLGFGTGYVDTYNSPPVNSYSPNGPYAAAHSYNANSLSHSGSFGTSSFGSSFGSVGKHVAFPTNGVGLIPPSGLYGVAPSSHYGTPLFQPNHNLNALEINQPKHPVIFREPVPHGLIESIGNAVAHKDAHGIIENSHINLGGPSYIPPPVSDITKPVSEPEPPQPSSLYSLPTIHNPISFQNLVHGSSTAGLVSDVSSNFNGYSGYLGGVDGNYALPLQTGQINFNVDQSHNNAISVDHAHGNAYDLNQGNGFNVEQSQSYIIGQSEGNALQSHGQSYSIGQSQGNTFALDQSRGHAFNSYNVNQAHGNVGFDLNSLSGGYAVQNLGGAFQHDCSLHKSQPLPQLSYGVPSANTYTEALSSLKTNIGGHFQPHLTYGPPDLQAAHSQSSLSINGGSSSNVVSDAGKESYGKSLGESFAAGGELIKSQSLDLNNIPVQGSLGSYTLQIQSADGLGAASTSGHVQHDQVLNDGLLQSILAAIEQPQTENANILGQPLLQHIQPSESQVYTQITNAPNGKTESTSDVEDRVDGETQQSVKNPVAVSSPVTEVTTVQNANETEIIQQQQQQQQQQQSADASLQLLDNNEIALYFSNNSETQNTKAGDGESGQEDNVSETDKVLNGQQYGSYVSFKTPNTSYVYGDLKPSQNEQSSDVKE